MWKEIAKHTWLLAVVALLYFGVVPIATKWIETQGQVQIARIQASKVPDGEKVIENKHVGEVKRDAVIDHPKGAK